MSYLIDTNVLSELRKPHCHPGVRRWSEQVDSDDCFISVLVLGEVRRGIDLIRKSDFSRARAFERWLNTLTTTYGNRILQVDIETALVWGSVSAIKNIPPIDAILGATAIQHNLAMVTRNTSDFESMPIELINPFDF